MSERWTGGKGQQRPVGPLPMKFFGAADIEKTPANCIPRLCTIIINRLILLKSYPPDVTSLMIAVKMGTSSKRTLRSAEISLNTADAASANGNHVEIELDLTFAIQYLHFLKKDGNQLQVLLQRKKRYKNRAILGCKTLAAGVINMAEVLQRCQFMEKELELRENSKDMRKSEVVARILMSSLKSQPVDHEVMNGRNLKLSLNESAEVDSEEDVDEFSPSDNSDSEPLEETSGTGGPRIKWQRRERKRRPKKNGSLGTGGLGTPTAHQRNLKQKFIALLKKFKIPDSEASDSEEQAALEKELIEAAAASDQMLGNIDDIFEFEDSDVDSVPEMDDMSVSSTPRPALKPFFSSKTTLVEENEEMFKRQGSGQSSEDFPVSSSPKPSLRPFFSSKTTLSSHTEPEEVNNRVDTTGDALDSSGASEHTPDTSDTSLKTPCHEVVDHHSSGHHKTKQSSEKSSDKKSKSQVAKEKVTGGSKNVKETISRLLRK